jgi:hypothetical protein
MHNTYTPGNITQGMEVDKPTRDCCTPFYWAVIHHNLATAQALLQRGAGVDVRSTNTWSRTPLYELMLPTTKCAWDADALARLLIEAQADANATDTLGSSPLMQARKSSFPRFLLLLSRACLNDALSIVQAIIYDRYEAFKMMVAHGASLITSCPIPAHLMPPGEQSKIPPLPVRLRTLQNPLTTLAIMQCARCTGQFGLRIETCDFFEIVSEERDLRHRRRPSAHEAR